MRGPEGLPTVSPGLAPDDDAASARADTPPQPSRKRSLPQDLHGKPEIVHVDESPPRRSPDSDPPPA
eukprot:1278150-Pyramimonas_sp.AAC.1